MTENGDRRRNEAWELTTAQLRRRLRDQHMELRRHLALAIVEIDGLASEQAARREHLRSRVGSLCDELAKDLAEEEAMMLPLLETDLPLGPAHAAELRQAHARERAEGDALLASRSDGDGLEIASRFDRLARALLREMAREERVFLAPRALPAQRPGPMAHC